MNGLIIDHDQETIPHSVDVIFANGQVQCNTHSKSS
jgi:hypothetical protein